MKNNIWFIIACILVFCVGYNLNDTAVSFQKYKVAVVDVPEILSHSEEIQELKRQQDKDMEELNILISKAQNEIINEKRKDKLIEKEASYRKQIETKKTEIDKKYNAKLEKVNNSIKAIISDEARKMHYNLVLPAGFVISGGEDITANIIKKMK
jgi:Skp family chaperone for outer membrane proteins